MARVSVSKTIVKSCPKGRHSFSLSIEHMTTDIRSSGHVTAGAHGRSDPTEASLFREPFLEKLGVAPVHHVGKRFTLRSPYMSLPMTPLSPLQSDLPALAHMAAIIESSDDAIISKDLSGIIKSWNGAAERIYGYSAAEAIGQPITMLIPTNLLHEETVILQKIRQGERIDHYETVRQRKDGSQVSVSLTVSPIKDASGQVIGASKSARDITERKRIEADLRALTEELDLRVEQRTQALTDSQERLRGLATELSLAEERVRRKIANELHDYLGQLLVVCRLKLTQATQHMKQTKAIQHVLRESPVMAQLQDADRMLQDSISYTRSLVAQLTPPVLREFGLVMALTWLADQMKQHGLTVLLKPDVLSVDLREDQAILLFQSVRELLMNVVKHAGVAEVALAIHLTNEQVFTVTVSDKGHGFNLATEQATTDKHFGLFSIRERMEAIGGVLQISTAPGQGTTASLIVSLQNPESTAPALSSMPVSSVSGIAAKSSGTAAVRILMVDDHPLVRQGMRGVVEGFENMRVVGEAADGQEAVQLAESLRPDVIIMDVNMPRMDGIEATRLIKRANPHITVIGLSVQNSEQVEAAMKAAGAASYLTKDAAPEQLYGAITTALEKTITP